jgi:hypothetical protein
MWIGAAAFSALALLPPPPRTFSDPLTFTNPYQPFVVGGVKLFDGIKDGATASVEDTYLAATRTFQVDGVSVACHILRESEWSDGVLTEVSHNFFAQADDGTVYYFGEIVDEYDEDGNVVSHEGSWLVGGPTLSSDPADTATATVPAVFMTPTPKVGDTWKPEDLFPFVDETVTVLKVDAGMNVPGGHFDGCLKVRETSALASGAEYKWYAPEVGVVKVMAGGEHLKLVSTTFGQ